MKLIIAGCRDYWPTYDEIDRVVKESGFKPTVIINGKHRAGVDKVAWGWAFSRCLERLAFPAQWLNQGLAAGPIRNREMAAIADAAVVFWDGRSRGSGNMIEEMRKLGKPVFVYYVLRK